MKKSLGVGISLAVIIGIIAVATITSMSSTEETITDDITLVEEVPVEETVKEVPVEEGRELTVELTEKIGFKNS